MSDWTVEQLDALVEAYTFVEVPPCRVCGEPLSVASMGGGALTEYACSSQDASDSVRAVPWQSDNHYSRSKWTQPKHGDGRVIQLVADYKALRNEVRRLTENVDLEAQLALSETHG